MPLMDSAVRIGLLQRARSAIARAIGAEQQTSDPESLTSHPESEVDAVAARFPEYEVSAGAFVTLRIDGHLRGCVGYPDPSLPLLEAIERCAVRAAIADPRFDALTVSEWDHVDLEISVLGSIEPVVDISDVKIGRDGLIVEFGSRRGLLLPQVATEWNWDALEFASQTCRKAGLPKDAWQKGAKLFRFEAEVFGDSEPR